jgi:hypothetical protein
MTANVVVVRKDAPFTDMAAALRDCRANASSPPARNLAAVLKETHLYSYPALSVSPYPDSALSAGQYATRCWRCPPGSSWCSPPTANHATAAPRPEPCRCRNSRAGRNTSTKNPSARPPDVLYVTNQEIRDEHDVPYRSSRVPPAAGAA